MDSNQSISKADNVSINSPMTLTYHEPIAQHKTTTLLLTSKEVKCMESTDTCDSPLNTIASASQLLSSKPSVKVNEIYTKCVVKSKPASTLHDVINDNRKSVNNTLETHILALNSNSYETHTKQHVIQEKNSKFLKYLKFRVITYVIYFLAETLKPTIFDAVGPSRAAHKGELKDEPINSNPLGHKINQHLPINTEQLDNTKTASKTTVVRESAKSITTAEKRLPPKTNSIDTRRIEQRSIEGM